jgi:hypothetical protein
MHSDTEYSLLTETTEVLLTGKVRMGGLKDLAIIQNPQRAHVSRAII